MKIKVTYDEAVSMIANWFKQNTSPVELEVEIEGIPVSTLDRNEFTTHVANWVDEVKALAGRIGGSKITAIKTLRSATGLGLYESKVLTEAVVALAEGLVSNNATANNPYTERENVYHVIVRTDTEVSENGLDKYKVILNDGTYNTCTNVRYLIEMLLYKAQFGAKVVWHDNANGSDDQYDSTLVNPPK